MFLAKRMITQLNICSPTEGFIKTELEIYCSTNLFKLCKKTHIKSNTDNWHLLVTSSNSVQIIIDPHTINNSTEETLIGVRIKSEVLPKSNSSTLLKKVIQEL